VEAAEEEGEVRGAKSWAEVEEEEQEQEEQKVKSGATGYSRPEELR
jgi:hypothetical protein